MQVSKIALAFAAGAALVAASASFAAVPVSAASASPVAAQAQAQSWTQAHQDANVKITRAQVRQELVDAGHNGQLDALRDLYRGS